MTMACSSSSCVAAIDKKENSNVFIEPHQVCFYFVCSPYGHFVMEKFVTHDNMTNGPFLSWQIMTNGDKEIAT